MNRSSLIIGSFSVLRLNSFSSRASCCKKPSSAMAQRSSFLSLKWWYGAARETFVFSASFLILNEFSPEVIRISLAAVIRHLCKSPWWYGCLSAFMRERYNYSLTLSIIQPNLNSVKIKGMALWDTAHLN